MRLGLTINMGNYESLRLESSEWENSYDCAMELINEIRKIGSAKAETCALAYLAPFTERKEPYKGEESEKIIKENKEWLKGNGI